jgi:hypothetical protein
LANDDYFTAEYSGMNLYDLWLQYLNDPSPVVPPEYVGRPRQKVVKEWEIDGELEVGSKVFDQFVVEARDRWAKGIVEYRDGDEEAPFSGDPLQEATEEAIDLYCYIKEAVEQALISDTEADEAMSYAFDAYKLIKRIQNARHDKLVDIMAGDQG